MASRCAYIYVYIVVVCVRSSHPLGFIHAYVLLTLLNYYYSLSPIHTLTQILVNNAGIATHGAVLDQSLADIDRILQVNTLSLLHLTHLFAQDMKRQRRYVVCVCRCCVCD